MEFRYVSREDGGVVTTVKAALRAGHGRGLPVRRFGSSARMGHYPGVVVVQRSGDTLSRQKLPWKIGATIDGEDPALSHVLDHYPVPHRHA